MPPAPAADATSTATPTRQSWGYVTNAVKHFKFTRADGGKRRIHKKPGRTEVVACTPWLTAEIESLQPDVVVCLGATAAQTLLGTGFRLTEHRGELFDLGTDGTLPVPRRRHTSLPPSTRPHRYADRPRTALKDSMRWLPT
jgi:DNA polymerase